MGTERSLPYNVKIEDVLTELLEYMEDKQDADHDGDGFVPNKEIRLAVDIQQALYQLERAKKNIVTLIGAISELKSLNKEATNGN